MAGAPKHNTNHLLHGGEAAVERIEHGLPFTGKAAEQELVVRADLDVGGKRAMQIEIAVRLHTAQRLFWQAFLAACDAGDLVKIDGYVQRFGWLAGAASRAWDKVPDADVIDLPTMLSQEVGDAEDPGD